MAASRESSLNTIELPAVGEEPAPLVSAVDHAFRVVVDNIGPVAAVISFDTSALQNSPVIAKTYYLRVGKDQTFVLQPGQRIYAVGEGAGGRVSIAASVAVTESFGA